MLWRFTSPAISMKFPPLIWTPEAEVNRGMGIEIEDEERTC
jgi:hypothetical protein